MTTAEIGYLLYEYNRYVRDSKNDFLTEVPYTFEAEFRNKRLLSGTMMPLSKYCYELELLLKPLPPSETYSKLRYEITAKYKLTQLGLLRYEQCKSTNFERSTFGTVALWGLRKNEKRRHLEKANGYSKNAGCVLVRNDWLSQATYIVEEVYVYALNLFNEFLQLQIDTMTKDEIRYWMFRYYIEQEKQQISITAEERILYETAIDNCDPVLLCKDHILLNLEIISKIYSAYRVFQGKLQEALRNRPADMTMINDIIQVFHDYAVVTLERSRQATGQTPQKCLWMMIYKFKVEIEHAILSKIKEVHNYEFFDPLTEPDFYYNMTHGVNGVYKFGDNCMIIKKGEITQIYDLSTSDVFQGYMRRNDRGNNLSFFQRLNAHHDTGSTGGPLTSLWTLEGQASIDKSCEKHGLFKDDRYYIEGLVEDATTFLGHHWTPSKQVDTLGLRCSVDTSIHRIPIRFKPYRIEYLKLEHKKKFIPPAEFAQTYLMSGLYEEWTIPEFYSWTKENRISVIHTFGVHERVFETLDTSKLHSIMQLNRKFGIDNSQIEKEIELRDKSKIQFLDHFDIEELERLAHPLKLEKRRKK